MGYRKLLDQIDDYFNRINNPQTEDDYYCLLVFWIKNAVFFASSDQLVLPQERKLGIFDSDTEVDFSKVEENLSQEIIDSISSIVKVIMEKFSVEHPSVVTVSGDKKSFQSWWDEISGQSWKTIPYPDFIFSRIKP